MAVRTGMTELIDRLRVLINVEIDDYTPSSLTLWTNQDLQDELDDNAAWLVDHPLNWVPQTIGGGTVNYLTALVGYRDWEQVTSGTTRWIIRDTTGSQIGTATYTADYRNGRITFTSNQAGSAYFLTGYSYDVYQSAVNLLHQKLASLDDWYDFSADNQTFKRSQAIANISNLIAKYEPKAGSNVIGAKSGQMSVSIFMRTDLQ